MHRSVTVLHRLTDAVNHVCVYERKGPQAPFFATPHDASTGNSPLPYSAMSFWMRSMASTVASASPKAVRRT